jgi:hypothetical protein
MTNKTEPKIGKNRGNAGKGRPKGSPNKITQEFRDTVKQLLDDNADNVAIWLSQVATGTEDAKADPKGALDILSRLAEFAAPKLARTEVVGDVKAPVRMVVTWKK